MKQKPKQQSKTLNFGLFLVLLILLVAALYFKTGMFSHNRSQKVQKSGQVESAEKIAMPTPQLDALAYDAKLNQIANNPKITSSSTTSTLATLWPVKTVYPNYGALLPFNRVVAYYGNLYSKNMGILGEYPEDEMLDRLNSEVKKWQEADPATPVIPALHYIAVVAQGGAGRDGKFRARMPETEINKVLAMAEKIDGIVFLDVQLGQSNVQTEVPLLEKYLKLPNVHLGIDPEFAMAEGQKPGTVIGTLDASDINFVADFLSKIIQENNLPPKILIIHRFTQKMLTNAKNIQPLPEVQVVINMDGFGSRGSKLNTYKQYIYKEPVQFTGFKLFYKNDSARGPVLEPQDLLKLRPIPIYIQYQ